MIYEIINPSDPITISTDDVLIAKAATLLLGHGAFGLRDETGESVLGIYLFGCGDEALQKEGFEDLGQFVMDHREELSRCFESAMVCGIKHRVALLAAIGDDPQALERFNESERTSMNNIAGRAFEFAAQLREAP
jgi:hypothetical protein